MDEDGLHRDKPEIDAKESAFPIAFALRLRRWAERAEATIEEVTEEPGKAQQESRQKEKGLRWSRRRILLTGLGIGGVSLGAWAWWTYAHSPKVFQHVGRSVTTVAWSPDGRYLASGDYGGTLNLWTSEGTSMWSVQGAAARASMYGNPNITAIAWSPDGRYLAIGGGRFPLIRDARNGRVWRVYDVPGTAMHNSSVVSWSPNGRFIASSDTTTGLIQIWNPLTGQTVRQLQANSDGTGHFPVTGISWSPDSANIATNGPQITDMAAIWKVATGEATVLPFPAQFNPDDNRMRAIGWSADGRSIAADYAAKPDGALVLWSWQANRKSWVPTIALADRPGTVAQLAWSPDSKRLATVGWNAAFQLWNGVTGAFMESIAVPFPPAGTYYLESVAWSPDGAALLLGDIAGQVLLWKAV